MKIEVEVPNNVSEVTNAATGIIACLVALAIGVIRGALGAVSSLFGGVFRVIGGAVAGGAAAARR